MISSFTPLSAATRPGAKVNEDGYGSWPAEAPRAAWVLDGVTGINDRALLPGPTDAAWFVAQVQEVLPRLLADSPDRPAADLVGALVAELEQRQAAAWLDGRGADGRETPAASFALVRLIGSEIEVLRLGDCLVLLEATEGTVTVMDHPVLAAIEAETRAALLALRAQGITDPKQAFTAMMPRLRAQRARRNLPDGYGVLAAERSCVPMLHVDRMPAHAVRRVLLASDGYYRLVDHYHAANDAELVRRTGELGADAMLEQLRAIEAADPLATRYPRLKIADDATALLIGMNQR
ncbi:MAG TPA: protein phosphatase 2C domain-containing protein [Dongiaceae bacterium]|nr:protein phosphatase 2C domain-containing protein [Dongiaceae bacterium]